MFVRDFDHRAVGVFNRLCKEKEEEAFVRTSSRESIFHEHNVGCPPSMRSFGKEQHKYEEETFVISSRQDVSHCDYRNIPSDIALKALPLLPPHVADEYFCR